MSNKKGFTLVEILVAVAIVGIIAAVGLPNYIAIKEKTLNKEAKVTLGIVRISEWIYRMQNGTYYGPQSDPAIINQFLKISLPVTAAPALPLWSISVDNASNIATATRTGAGADARVWSINLQGDTDPACVGGTYCL